MELVIKASLISLLNEKHLRSEVISKIASEVATDAVTPTKKAATVIITSINFGISARMMTELKYRIRVVDLPPVNCRALRSNLVQVSVEPHSEGAVRSELLLW